MGFSVFHTLLHMCYLYITGSSASVVLKHETSTLRQNHNFILVGMERYQEVLVALSEFVMKIRRKRSLAKKSR